MRSRGSITLGHLFALFIGGVVLWWGSYFGPHYFARYRMNDVTIRTLKHWKATDDEYKTRKFLAGELAGRKYEGIVPEVCRLEPRGLFKHIKCQWRVTVKEPVMGEHVLRFKVDKYLNAEGLLEDVD